MYRLIKSLTIPTQPTVASNVAWPSDLDLAISTLSMRRYTSAVVTSQIKAKSRSLGLHPEPMRLGHGISSIDYCSLAKKPSTTVWSPECFSSDGSEPDHLPYVLPKARQISVDELDTLPHATRMARRDSIYELSTLRKLSIDENDCKTSTSITSAQIFFERSLQPTALSLNNSPKPRLQRSQSIRGRLEGNCAHKPNLVMAPATLLECVFEERLEEGVEELTNKSIEYQTATATATPSLIHTRRSSIRQDDGWMDPLGHLTLWIDPLLAMFGRLYGV